MNIEYVYSISLLEYMVLSFVVPQASHDISGNVFYVN